MRSGAGQYLPVFHHIVVAIRAIGLLGGLSSSRTVAIWRLRWSRASIDRRSHTSTDRTSKSNHIIRTHMLVQRLLDSHYKVVVEVDRRIALFQKGVFHSMETGRASRSPLWPPVTGAIKTCLTPAFGPKVYHPVVVQRRGESGTSIAESLRNETSEAAICAFGTSPNMDSLSSACPGHVLKLSFSGQDLQRMHQLANKNQEGILTDEERQELDNYMNVGDLIAMLQSKARILFKPYPFDFDVWK